MFIGNQPLYQMTNRVSRSISAENFKGEKGRGGMATEGTGAGCARELGQGWKVSPSYNIMPGEVFEIADIEGPGVIRHFWIVDCSGLSRRTILRMYWDGSETPSVETPLCDFFAQADYRQYAPLSSAVVTIGPKSGFNCYWEMPFYKRCRMTIENIHTGDITVFYQIDYTLEELPEGCGYFHAQFRRVNPLPYKEVYTILDNVHGKGQYVGTYMFWGVNNCGWWGEGEIKFYLDGDKEFPTICGTGTEDYFCGSHSFQIGPRYQEFCTPYAGMNKVIRPDGLYQSQTRFSLYRWHVMDPVYFDSDIRVTMQAIGWRPSKGTFLPLQDDLSSVAFWYQDSTNDTFPEFPDADALEII